MLARAGAVSESPVGIYTHEHRVPSAAGGNFQPYTAIGPLAAPIPCMIFIRGYFWLIFLPVLWSGEPDREYASSSCAS